MNEKVRTLRKKPIEVQAIQFFDDNETIKALEEFVNDQAIRIDYSGEKPRIGLMTLESGGQLFWADEADWIIKGVKGEFYPCKPDICAMTYDLL
jgi:hypothetical protein